MGIFYQIIFHGWKAIVLHLFVIWLLYGTKPYGLHVGCGHDHDHAHGPLYPPGPVERGDALGPPLETGPRGGWGAVGPLDDAAIQRMLRASEVHLKTLENIEIAQVARDQAARALNEEPRCDEKMQTPELASTQGFVDPNATVIDSPNATVPASEFSFGEPDKMESEHWAYQEGARVVRDRHFQEYLRHIYNWQHFGWTRHHPAIPSIIREDLPEDENIMWVPRSEILRRIGWDPQGDRSPQDYMVVHGFIDQSQYDVWVAEPHPLRESYRGDDLHDLVFMREPSIIRYAPNWETPMEGPDHYNRMFPGGKRPKPGKTVSI